MDENMKAKEPTKAERLAEALAELMELPSEERDFATGLKKGSGRASDTATGLPIIYD